MAQLPVPPCEQSLLGGVIILTERNIGLLLNQNFILIECQSWDVSQSLHSLEFVVVSNSKKKTVQNKGGGSSRVRIASLLSLWLSGFRFKWGIPCKC